MIRSDRAENGAEAVSRFQAQVRQVVTIHQAMFDKLLADHVDLPLELAELLEDAANVYLGLSEEISQRHVGVAWSDIDVSNVDVEEHSHTAVMGARRVLEAKLVAEPGIASAENIAEPVEREADRPGVEPLGQSQGIERY